MGVSSARGEVVRVAYQPGRTIRVADVNDGALLLGDGGTYTSQLEPRGNGTRGWGDSLRRLGRRPWAAFLSILDGVAGEP